MNDNTSRGLLVAGLCANALFLALALLDYAAAGSRYMWPIFVGWAFLVMLLVILALASAGVRVATAAPRPAPAAAAPVAPAAPAPVPPAAPKPARFEPAADAPFTFNGYTLHTRKVALKNGGDRTIWFFSKRTPASGTASPKPAGFHVGVNERTGLPFLKKGAGPDGEDLTPRLQHALRPQCSALTEDGKQCRNSAREASKYCASHFGYQPPQMAKAEAARKDTRARVRGAPDTVPAVRRRPAA
jgi:hypothetical protein